MLRHKSTIELDKLNLTTSFLMIFLDDEIKEDDLVRIITDYEKKLLEKQYVQGYKIDYDYEFNVEPNNLEVKIEITLKYTDLQLADEKNQDVIENQEKDFMDFYNLHKLIN
jgi:hypothetical protein